MRTRRMIYSAFITLLAYHVALLMPALVMAQESAQQGRVQQTVPSIIQIGEGNQYYLGAANELLIRVNVWGRIARPGQYFVPATTDLVTLISAAGGPVPRARLTDIQLVRAPVTGQAGEVIEVNLKKYLRTGDRRLIPPLKPEDTIVVHGSVWQLISDISSVISAVAVVGTVYYYFFILKRR